MKSKASLGFELATLISSKSAIHHNINTIVKNKHKIEKMF